MQNAQREHSAILSTFIKLPFVFKTFFVFFEWWHKTGFTIQKVFFITLDGDTADCPSGSGSCRKIKSGDKYIMQDVGELQQSLQRSTDKRLTLHYSTSADVEGCTTKPTTTINFICPERGGVRILFLDLPFSCQYIFGPENVIYFLLYIRSQGCKILKFYLSYMPSPYIFILHVWRANTMIYQTNKIRNFVFVYRD